MPPITSRKPAHLQVECHSLLPTKDQVNTNRTVHRELQRVGGKTHRYPMRGNPSSNRHTEKKLKALQSPIMAQTQMSNNKKGRVLRKNVYFNISIPLQQQMSSQTAMRNSYDNVKPLEQRLVVDTVGHEHLHSFDRGQIHPTQLSPNSRIRRSNLIFEVKSK